MLVSVALVLKNLPAIAGDIKGTSSVSGLRRSPGGGNGNPLQYSYMKNPMEGARQAAVRGLTKSWTRLKRLSTPYNTVTQPQVCRCPLPPERPSVPPPGSSQSTRLSSLVTQHTQHFKFYMGRRGPPLTPLSGQNTLTVFP